MKKYTTILFFVLVSISINAQNKDTETADKLFDRYEYVQALNEYLYLALVENGSSDSYVCKQLGECYYNLYNTIEAEKWYGLAVKSNQDAEIYYRYAQMLKANGKYELANEQMKIFSSKVPNDQRAIEFLKDPNYLPKLYDIKKLFDVEKLKINSDKSDFGAILYNNTLYFASARNENTKIYGWNNEPFLDLYQSNFNKKEKTYSEPTPITELNSIYHEGPLTMTKDGNTIYFSSESFNEKQYLKDKVKKLKYGQVNLYKAVKVGGKWTSIKSLPFNNKRYSNGNPTIDSTGTTLYFASNMPGSKGGTDIWKVAVNSDDTFGNPVNLGDKINTPGDENFPFVTDDNILYFSSNGLPGFGSLDVFSVDLNKNEEPLNLGKPVNTEKDDFAFTFNKENIIGYLSSNRSGNDDIYVSTPVRKSQILTVVKDIKTGLILENSKVVILDSLNNILETKMSNEKGEVVYDVESGKSYSIEVSKEGFETKSFVVDDTKSDKITVDAYVSPIEINVADTETTTILNPIYFEFNKSNITKKGAAELDKLVYVMSQNDKLIINVKAHTDNRGSDAYNMYLSDRRAKSTVQYIISKGVNKDRISGKGFGESEPKIDCKANCTGEEHALNRRSEFLIVK